MAFQSACFKLLSPSSQYSSVCISVRRDTVLWKANLSSSPLKMDRLLASSCQGQNAAGHRVFLFTGVSNSSETHTSLIWWLYITAAALTDLYSTHSCSLWCKIFKYKSRGFIYLFILPVRGSAERRILPGSNGWIYTEPLLKV